MIDDNSDGSSVIMDLEPSTALLLRRVIEAGLQALQGDLTAAQREQLAGLSMFLGDAARWDGEFYSEGSRLVA
jgi:hypothetical protein